MEVKDNTPQEKQKSGATKCKNVKCKNTPSCTLTQDLQKEGKAALRNPKTFIPATTETKVAVGMNDKKWVKVLCLRKGLWENDFLRLGAFAVRHLHQINALVQFAEVERERCT